MIRALCYCCLLLCTPLWAAQRILNVYTWSDFVPPSVVQQFEQETGIKVNLSVYDSNEAMYAKVKASSGADFDVVFPSIYYLPRMIQHHMLKPLDKRLLPNIKHLEPRFLGLEVDPKNQYSLPYVWSTTGIVVNKKAISPATVTGWEDLWQPRFSNQLLMLDDMREVFSMALMTLGYSANDTNPKHIEAAYQKLRQILPNIRLFNSIAQLNIYLDEDIHIGMCWSGEAQMAQAENPNLTFIHPKEGFIIQLDTTVILSKSKHIKEAHEFLNFLMRPAVAKAITLSNHYSTTNRSTLKLLPPKMATNPTYNPSAKTLQRGQFQLDTGASTAVYEHYWERLKVESR